VAAGEWWIGPLILSPLWAWGSTLLFLQGWLASADVVIALLGFARGRLPAPRATGAVAAALATGVVCSVLLRLGFWLLVDVSGYGRTGLAQLVYWCCVLGAALHLVPKLPSKVRGAWQKTMSPVPVEEKR